MAEPVLAAYRDDIARLYFDQRHTQAEIIRYLEQAHGIRTNKATLSRFLRTLPDAQLPVRPGELHLSPDEEAFFKQAEVFVGVSSRLDELVDQATKLHARFEVLENAATERHVALVRQMQHAENTGGQVSHGVMLRVWRRAALSMGLAWGMLVILGFLGWFWWSQPEATAKPPVKQETPVKKPKGQ